MKSTTGNHDNSSATLIKKLRLYGNYNVTIDTNDLYYLPSPSSHYGYFQMRIPSILSNVTIRVADDNISRAEFVLLEGVPSTNSDDYKNIVPSTVKDAKIAINNVKSLSLPYLPITLKSPTIEAGGQTVFRSLRSHFPNDPSRLLADSWPTEVNGDMAIKLDHVIADPVSPTRYVTYFNWIKVNASQIESYVPSLGQPLIIPWNDIIYSEINLRLVPILVIVAAIVIYFGTLSTSGFREKVNNSHI